MSQENRGIISVSLSVSVYPAHDSDLPSVMLSTLKPSHGLLTQDTAGVIIQWKGSRTKTLVPWHCINLINYATPESETMIQDNTIEQSRSRSKTRSKGTVPMPLATDSAQDPGYGTQTTA